MAALIGFSARSWARLSSTHSLGVEAFAAIHAQLECNLERNCDVSSFFFGRDHTLDSQCATRRPRDTCVMRARGCDTSVP
eukprot:847862-Rhodomonas_salina.1